MFPDFRERSREKERRKGREEGNEDQRDRERGRERNIDLLPPPRGACTRAQTHNPLLYGMMLLPAEPPRQSHGSSVFRESKAKPQSSSKSLVSVNEVIIPLKKSFLQTQVIHVFVTSPVHFN